MSPVENQSSPAPAMKLGVPQVIEGPEGERYLRLLSSVPSSTTARQIAVRPQEDRLLIFKVGGANGDEGGVMLRHELLETVQLPESVDPFTVEATINKDGLLEVNAPLAH